MSRMVFDFDYMQQWAQCSALECVASGCNTSSLSNNRRQHRPLTDTPY